MGRAYVPRRDAAELRTHGASVSAFHRGRDHGRGGCTVPMKADGLAWEAAWLGDTHVLVNSSTSFNSLPGLWLLDLASDSWIPITREFAVFHGISLTADRLTGVATRTEDVAPSGWEVPLEEDGNFVVDETLAGPASPVVDLMGGIVYSAHTTKGVSTLYRLESGASRHDRARRGRFWEVPQSRRTGVSSSSATALSPRCIE